MALCTCFILCNILITDHIIPKPQILQSTNPCKWYLTSGGVCVYGRDYDDIFETFSGGKDACCAPGLSFKELSTCRSDNKEENGPCPTPPPTPPVSMIFEDLFMLTLLSWVSKYHLILCYCSLRALQLHLQKLQPQLHLRRLNQRLQWVWFTYDHLCLLTKSRVSNIPPFWMSLLLLQPTSSPTPAPKSSAPTNTPTTSPPTSSVSIFVMI